MCIVPLAHRIRFLAQSACIAISIIAILNCSKVCAKSCASRSPSNWPAVSSGQKIDYVGVAGAFEFGDNGDPTVSLFDIFEYQKGKLVVLKQIDATK